MTDHAGRIRAAAAAFKAANHTLIADLDALDEGTAMRPPAAGGWSAAQIGWHVAETSRLLAAMLAGELPGPRLAPGFVEDAEVFSRVPARVESRMPEIQPPGSTTRQEAITRLRASEAPTVLAIESLTPERAGGYTFKMPFGILNLYQCAEFIGAHAGRHRGQVQRCLAAREASAR
ncbi:MAG TPA: DinB family protein [Ramlibacter sp.]|nr:DinB family protein [Ramlibacter sp.]